MKIIFADINKQVTDALKARFIHDPNVEVHHGDIFQHKADAIVSPANSFGYMDGGIDLVYSEHFGWDLQESLQSTINQEFNGELLVGQAVIVRTNNAEIPYLISAPTMRVPMNIQGTVNVYLAFRAALRAAKLLNDLKPDAIKSILCPGMGTFVGHMDPEVAATQMFIAYSEVHRGLKFDQPGIHAKYKNHLLIAHGKSTY